MSTDLSAIVNLLDSTLDSKDFSDFAVNGLQLEACPAVLRAATAVDASLTTVREAARLGANLLVVHHGLFWTTPVPITGAFAELVRLCVTEGVNIYASHLPLDAHPDLGNSWSLARLIGLNGLEPALEVKGKKIGCIGKNPRASSVQELAESLRALPGAGTPLVCGFGPPVPEKILVVTGAACDALYTHKDIPFDTLVTGEPRQFAYHYARDNGLNLICGGHYATETLGVRNLGALLEKQFSLSWSFIDCPTGI